MRGPDWTPRLDDLEIQEYLEAAAGEEGIELFTYILENEPISGEDIVEHYPDQKPSGVRKILYKLMEAHALEYHKDTDTKGWETFTWQTDLPELKLIHQRRWADDLLTAKKQLRFEKDHEFYTCEDAHQRIIFEDALDLEFHCPECEAPMQPVDNAAEIEALETRIRELEPVSG